jgi:hypothetical protein
MTLDPGNYECPTHHTDLTGLVEEALDNSLHVAYRRPLLGRKPAGPFQVIVTCPGTGGARPHPLTCTGKQAP